MFEELIDALKEKGYTIGSIESLTAGAFVSSIANVPGASSVLKGGLVTYVSELKTKLADVDAELINKYGVVSAEVAKAMAIGGQRKLGTDVAISFTGNAGPTALEGKPVGKVYIGIAIKDEIFVDELLFVGSRNEIRNATINYGAEKIIKLLKRI